MFMKKMPQLERLETRAAPSSLCAIGVYRGSLNWLDYVPGIDEPFRVFINGRDCVGNLSIDWGDGSPIETYKGVTNRDDHIAYWRTYDEPGYYVRKILYTSQNNEITIAEAFTFMEVYDLEENPLRTKTIPPLLYDVNEDGNMNVLDLDAYFENPSDINMSGTVNRIDELMLIYNFQVKFGDVNFDDSFSTQDIINVFQAGKYNVGDPLPGPKWNGHHWNIDFTLYWQGQYNEAVWAEGDWNFDGVFNSSDLILAMQEGYDR